MIYFVAPYSPIDESDHPHLGAARKIELFIKALTSLGHEVLLINSAHNQCRLSAPIVRRRCIAGARVCEIIPRTLPNRALGKLINLFEIRAISRIAERLAPPDLIWIYNAYAFECAIAHYFKRVSLCPVILEFEDAVFARRRGLNVKATVDQIFWCRLKKWIDHAFCVNDDLRRLVGTYGTPATLIPGVVDAAILKLLLDAPAFRSPDGDIVVGYFGGLSVEKGADIILELSRRAPAAVRFVVCGSGPLEGCFREAAASFPKHLEFKGLIPSSRLEKEMGACDVLLNLHKVSSALYRGVFPFKLIEYVGSGRLVISTPVLSRGISEVLQGVIFVDGRADVVLPLLLNSREIFARNYEKIQRSAWLARERFSLNALTLTLEAICKPMIEKSKNARIASLALRRTSG